MWYAIQAAIALYIAYIWTTLPGNEPKDFGHGLFLGGVIAWFVTLTLCAVIDAINTRRQRRLQSSLRVVDRRAQEKPKDKIAVSRRAGTRPPKLIR